MSDTIAAIGGSMQPNISTEVCEEIKRLASAHGGLAPFLRKLGLPFRLTWERVNRGKGGVLDTAVELANVGIDGPLMKAVSRTPYELTPKLAFLRKKIDPARPVRAHALDIHHAAAALSMMLEDALADQEIDRKEREALKAEAHKVRLVLAGFEARIAGSEPNRSHDRPVQPALPTRIHHETEAK